MPSQRMVEYLKQKLMDRQVHDELLYNLNDEVNKHIVYNNIAAYIDDKVIRVKYVDYDYDNEIFTILLVIDASIPRIEIHPYFSYNSEFYSYDLNDPNSIQNVIKKVKELIESNHE